MNKVKLNITAIAAIIFFMNINIAAQDRIRDVVALNDNVSVITGFINEQTVGKGIRIEPVASATLKIAYDKLARNPEQVKDQADGITYDVITLKNNQQYKGTIIESSPGNWLVIKIDAMPFLDVSYSTIFSIRKELVSPGDNIFEAYGINDVLVLSSGEVARGVIIENVLEKDVKIRTKDLKTLVYGVDDIVTIKKEAVDNGDILKQSAFIDAIYTTYGVRFRGIITEQIIGQSIAITTDNGGFERIPIKDVAKIGKEKNIVAKPEKTAEPATAFVSKPDKPEKPTEPATANVDKPEKPAGKATAKPEKPEKATEKATAKTDKPEKTTEKAGSKTAKPEEKAEKAKAATENAPESEIESICYTIKDDSSVSIQSYAYKPGKNKKYVTLEKGPAKASDVFKIDTDIVLYLKVEGDIESVMSELRIVTTVYNAPNREKNVIIDDKQTETPGLTVEKHDAETLKITYTAGKAGDYAVWYTGCKAIALFRVEK